MYDDGCHLLKFAANPMRSGLTTTAERIAQMHIVIDRMHFKGHIDPWCKAHCNPNDLSELEKVLKQQIFPTTVMLVLFRLTLKSASRHSHGMAVQIC